MLTEDAGILGFVTLLLQGTVSASLLTHAQITSFAPSTIRSRENKEFCAYCREVCRYCYRLHLLCATRPPHFASSHLDADGALAATSSALLAVVPLVFQSVTSSSLLHFYPLPQPPRAKAGSVEWLFEASEAVCQDLLLANNALDTKELTATLHVPARAGIHP